MITIPQTLDFGAFTSFGWNTLKTHFKVLFKFFVLYFVLLIVPNIIVEQFQPSIFSILFSLALTIWQVILSMGMMKLSLDIIDGKSVSFETIMKPKDVFWTYVWGSLRLGIQVFVGFLLLIVPGVIWAIQYQFVPWLIIDKKMSVDEAFTRSSEMTQGKKMNLFIIGLGFAVINILGALMLGLGLIISVPVTSFALVGIYRFLEKSGKQPTSPKTEEGKIIA